MEGALKHYAVVCGKDTLEGRAYVLRCMEHAKMWGHPAYGVVKAAVYPPRAK